MKKKYLFFDIDGTLTTVNPGGIIPESTLNTIKKLEKNGHFVAIATGRAQHSSLTFANEVGINNIVSDGGHGLTLDGKLIDIEPLNIDSALEVIDIMLSNSIKTYVSIDNSNHLYTNICNPTLNHYSTIISDPNFDFHKQKKIFKIFLEMTIEQEKQFKILDTVSYVRYHPDSIIIEPDDKFKGITSMMNYLNAPLEDIVVFGDGKNDYSMFQKAPFSIAMGNAIDELKEIASFVTKCSNDDGIEYACKHFGWID